MQRNLSPRLEAWLDDRLFHAPLIGPLSASASPRQALIDTARACVGVSESGENKGELVELFQSTVGAVNAEAWCLSFIQSCIAYVERRLGLRSPLPAVEHCLTLWNAAKAYSAVSPPSPGDIILWRQGSTASGHVGLITFAGERTFATVEGNTGPGAGIERDGDGVYAKTRPRGGTKTFVEVGFLRVF